MTVRSTVVESGRFKVNAELASHRCDDIAVLKEDNGDAGRVNEKSGNARPLQKLRE